MIANVFRYVRAALTIFQMRLPPCPYCHGSETISTIRENPYIGAETSRTIMPTALCVTCGTGAVLMLTHSYLIQSQLRGEPWLSSKKSSTEEENDE